MQHTVPPHIARIPISHATYTLIDRIRRLRVATSLSRTLETPSAILTEKITANWSAIYNDLAEEHAKLLAVAQGAKALVTEKLSQKRRYLLAIEVAPETATVLERICADRFSLGDDPLACRPSAILEEVLSAVDFDFALNNLQDEINTRYARQQTEEVAR
jgi:hypothetical protein